MPKSSLCTGLTDSLGATSPISVCLEEPLSVAHTPQGPTLPAADSTSGVVAFKHNDPLAGAPGLDCSQPGSGAAENHLPFSFPLK